MTATDQVNGMSTDEYSKRVPQPTDEGRREIYRRQRMVIRAKIDSNAAIAVRREA